MSTFYGIEKVRSINQSNTIDELWLWKCEDGSNLQPLSQWYSRREVIDAIEAGGVFMTVGIDKTGNRTTWCKGADVYVIRTSNGKYLRTDRNSTSRDNLGKLPITLC